MDSKADETPSRVPAGLDTSSPEAMRPKLPAAQLADETCRLLREVERNGLRLELWTCSSPDPRAAPRDYTPGVFRRGKDFPVYVWPGGHDAWSCNSTEWPGHIDLVLYLGGPEEAKRTELAIQAHEAQQELLRAQQAKFQADYEERRSKGRLTNRERWAEASKARGAQAKQEADELERREAQRRLLGEAKAIHSKILARSFGKKSFVTKLGKHRRRIFLVSPEEAARDASVVSQPGWYVHAVAPPAGWLSNDPIGPYGSVKALLDDTGPAFEEEEEG
jgi:hypothetical protein